MDMFVIRGEKPLRGTVRISGSKNAALPIMAAVLASEGTTVLRGLPKLVDVTTLSELLRTLGVDIADRDKGLALRVVDEEPCVADYELVRRMRASFCVLGPLLARRGRACVSLPGGCNIGDRPIDLHLKGLRALGADIRVERGYVIAEATRLRGNSIYLGGPFGSTVTGTCNVMIAATLADGITTIEAASCEPEVTDLGNCLNQMGAQISGLGTPFLRIEGVQSLHGIEYTVIPDRIEAATFLIAAAITGGQIDLENARLSHLTAVVEKLREIGVSIETVTNDVTVHGTNVVSANARGQAHFAATASSPECTNTCRKMSQTPACERLPNDQQEPIIRASAASRICPADCIALPYPGIPTDVQAQLMALLTRADGISIVTDKVFPDRFLHASELVRMGAQIRREGASAIINGVPGLSGACVMASDLRASAALVLTALAANGDSVVRRIYHLDRGYDRLDLKLNSLGADIRRVKDTPDNMPHTLKLTDLADHHRPSVETLGHQIPPPKWRRKSQTASRSVPNADD